MVDYSKQFFGKSLLDLSYEDVELFFHEEREESNILEFKSGLTNAQDFDNILNKKIIRAIASFLNSEGGLLIWGSPRETDREKAGKNVRVAQGALHPNKVFNEKDQLINKITRSISYMPTGIIMNTLQHEEDFIYIFEIQESQSKPHQYADQYLIRIDGQTLPAPHYLVDSMFKTIRVPEIDGRVNFKSVAQDEYESIRIKFDIVFFNLSPIINEKNLLYQIKTSVGWIFQDIRSNYYDPTTLAYIDTSNEFYGSTGVLHYGRPNLASYFIHLSPQDLNNNEIKVSLSFGGELATAKLNQYRLKANEIQLGRFNFRMVIIDFFENITFKERQETLGNTHEDALKLLLNR